MKKRFSVRFMLITMMVLFSANIVWLAFQGVMQSRSLLSTAQVLSRTVVPSVASMTLVDMMHDGIRANVLNSILYATKNSPTSLDDIEAEAKEFEEKAASELAKLKALTFDEAIRADIDIAITEFNAYIQAAKSVREAALAGDLKEAKIRVEPFLAQFEKLEESLGKLGERIEGSAQTIQKATDVDAARDITKFIVISIASVIASILLSLAILHRSSSILRTASQELAGAATKVQIEAEKADTSSNELATDMQAQAAALQQTAATVHEISEMARLSADNAADVRNAANDAVQTASGGKSRVRDLVEAFSGLTNVMNSIQVQVEDSNAKFADVAKVIQDIGSKTQLINEIVFQTKLLSFNASVEAARAGEHGKGFAVVAEEVGNLARNSGSAAEEISRILSSSRQKVDDTINDARSKMSSVMSEFSSKLSESRSLAEDCDTTLDKVVGVAQHVQSKIDQISGALREQSSGVTEMSKTLEDFGAKIANSNKEASDTAQAASHLLSTAVELRSSVEQMSSRFGIRITTDMQVNPNTQPVSEAENVEPENHSERNAA